MNTGLDVLADYRFAGLRVRGRVLPTPTPAPAATAVQVSAP